MAPPIPAPAPQKPTLAKYKIRDAFSISEASDTAEILGFSPGLANVPSLDANYVFEQDTLRDFCMFWAGGFRALKIEGDPSAGKTSYIQQIHARLNVPLYGVPCSPTTEAFKLIGQLLPTESGTLRWQDGPVLKACREGSSCLLDEYNTLDPGEATGLNMLLEGYSWTVPETGEVITPARTTRFFVTQNSVDSKAAVAGRNIQDVANDDRFCYMRVDYLRPEVEKALVVRHLVAGRIPQELAETIAGICVDVAHKVREAFRNDSHLIEKPLSTRVVLRWAKLAVMFAAPMRAKNRSGLHHALHRAVPMSVTMGQAVEEMVTAVAGYGPDSATA